ncbi:cyclopropane-fatty-acyl-phospholipid synthase family protein [Actinoplanes sp. TRM 88003]|uniref:Cyclopropane-fatty-acyl-phospholipid synthase family protein n=1 Tax=Paractinoplanes aksuensis TaxID=2939490 RepID=A0ABT1E551_9ACTN|nr:cyclopropane-fatty-acyl-phospholipid synthase family protein [Actinoplanes aksuensis]MCO8277993.1 cyclopropane-fatty-acyl-phospholipid synthase family protein [Actinoplanes aksuensis]
MSHSTSQSQIESHYDLSNSYYALWLDESMTYSAALWGGTEADPAGLADAQQAKYHRHLDLAGAPGVDGSHPDGFRLLDIGCGWGGMVRYALDTGRVTAATGLTLSRAQHSYFGATPRPGGRVLVESWETHRPEQPYDAIVSIGAFEHFVTADTAPEQRAGAYESYFQRCHQLLRPGASMSLQTIAYDGVAGTAGPVGAFVTGDIFPGSTLPRLVEIAAACDAYFSVEQVTSHPDDYAKTLTVWSARLTAARAQAEELVGPDEYRRYRVYLKACEATFRRRAATLYRIGFRRRDEPLFR